MEIDKCAHRHEILIKCLYLKCKELNANIAILGTKYSAAILLEAIDRTDIPIAGIFEKEEFKKDTTFKGYPVQPIEELAGLRPDDVVIIASSAEATDLDDTFFLIQSLCSCKTLHFKSLLDLFYLREELKEPLKFDYDEFLFAQINPTETTKYPYWYPLPPGVDFKNKTILELGPFEGQVSLMIMKQSPKKVIALEARPYNYAKTSVISSLNKWQNYELLLGDMHLFPQLVKEKIDIIFCAGVLYHSAKPWWLLKTCMEQCNTIILCTHVASKHSPPHHQKKEVISLESGTYQFEVHEEYGWEDHLSGVSKESLWFKEEDLIQFLDFYGFQYKKFITRINQAGLAVGSVVTAL